MKNLLCVLVICLGVIITDAYAGPVEEDTVAQWLANNKNNSVALRQFVQMMPKGADLHNHLSGSTYAENYLQWGMKAQYCFDFDKYHFISPPCESAGGVKKLSALGENEYELLVERMSTKNYKHGTRSGHDQFFFAFDIFKPFSSSLDFLPLMLASTNDRAANQNILNLELMIGLQYQEIKKLGIELQKSKPEDFSQHAAWLKTHGLDDIVRAALGNLDLIDAEYESIQNCKGQHPAPGCLVQSRWIQHVVRGNTPEEVFAQIMFALELIKHDKRVVGINLVGAEDGFIALRDYRLHMEMLGYLASSYSQVNISLHAGELTIGLVPPDHLTNHIADAINIGGAKRIGHGVDIAFEHSAFELMQQMKDRDILVEICLTSNDLILGVKGKEHPLTSYLEAGVPVALASDDEGVSRIDLSHEYLRAVTEHGLGYRQLKNISRSSLAHSFLLGENLWADRTQSRMVSECELDQKNEALISRSCREFLDKNEKAARQWKLEINFNNFEKNMSLDKLLL